MVAASPVIGQCWHYVGGYLFGLASQIVVAFVIPWLLILWVLSLTLCIHS